MAIDGRDTRWDQHRADRRRALVSDALRAIRVSGPGVGMEEIAARAVTSKTVIGASDAESTPAEMPTSICPSAILFAM